MQVASQPSPTCPCHDALLPAKAFSIIVHLRTTIAAAALECLFHCFYIAHYFDMKALLDLPSSRFTPDSLARRSPCLRSLHDQPRLDNSPAAICVYSFGFAFLLCFFPSGSTLHQYILSQNGLTMSELRQGALATLTAQYSDSENESDGEGLSDRVVATPLNDASETSSPPTSAHKEGDRLRIPVIDNLARIESRSNSPSSNLLTSIESLAAASFTHHQKEVEIIDDEDRPSSPSSFHATLQGLTPDQITIPPAPPGHCSKSLLEKIDKLHNKMQNGADMNGAIQRRKGKSKLLVFVEPPSDIETF